MSATALLGDLGEQTEVLAYWEIEEDRLWGLFQVPQTAYENAVERMATGDATALDDLLAAAQKMGKAAAKVAEARERGRQARESMIETLDGVEIGDNAESW